MMLEIKTFQNHHTQSVGDLIVPIQSEEFGIAITLADQPDLSDISGFYQRGNGNFWVAEWDGEVVGSIALLDIGNAQAALRKMFVAKDFRGKEYGVASRLLNHLLHHSREHRLQEIFLGTTAQFVAAHRFYEKHGFEEISKVQLPSAFPVMAIDSKFYRFSL